MSICRPILGISRASCRFSTCCTVAAITTFPGHSAGQVNLILDNLYAEGKLKNMIVVMPTGHVPGPSRGMVSLMAVIPTTILCPGLSQGPGSVCPEDLSVYTRREDTAIAGFSMGGVQTLNLALWHPEIFGYVFPLSTGFFPDGIKQIDEKYSSVMKNVAPIPSS